MFTVLVNEMVYGDGCHVMIMPVLVGVGVGVVGKGFPLAKWDF